MSGAPTHHAEITQAPSAPVETEAAPAPEVPEIPAVNAAHGMGGIKMIEELQRHIHTFAGTDESHLSDMQKHILHGDATKLAEEYKLYDPNAASNMQSAFITEDSTLGFDGRGNLVLTPHGGEASVLDADHPYAGPHMQPPAPETPHPVAAPVAEQSQGTSVAPVTEPYASLHDPSSGPAQTFAAPDTPHAIETGVSDNIIHNSFGLDIHTDQAHIYSLDAKAKHLFVFGGETNDKLKIISQYWKTNPKGVVYEVEPDTKNAKHIYRFAWRLVNGAPVKESPARTSSFLSIFSPWKGDIEPRNFRKLIQ